MFYPDDAPALEAEVSAYMEQGRTASTAGAPATGPKAIIAPHAGYRYSGPIAGSVYARLAPLRHRIERVILVGPSHFVGFHGIAASSADAFDSPLGRVPLDRPCIDRLVERRLISILDEAHRREHALEVHLPFLQRCLDRFTLVPLVVGDAEPPEVAAVFEAAWGGDETLLVVSSDLSHYLEYTAAQRLDRCTADAIEALNPEAIDADQACGCLPIQGLLLLARTHGLKAETVDLRNSGDTAGPRNEVVGYGGFCFR
jgi:AmmeMemoRadiSam system protein B